MYIVINSCNIAFFKNIKEFKLDLGSSLFRVTETSRTLKVQDSNVLDYGRRYERICNKIGSIGAIGIYTDSILTPNQILLSENEAVLKKEMDKPKFVANTRDYIVNLIKEVKGINDAPSAQLTDEDRIRIWREQMRED